jgi:DUF4097 and DUF4098 domain-containing protein YvlB
MKSINSKEATMSRRAFRIITVVAALILLGGMSSADEQTREFAVSAGGTLELNLEAGGSVVVRGDGGSKITVTYEIDQNSTIEFRESSSGLEIVTDYKSRGRSQSSSVDIEVHVPAHFDIELDSMGGGLTVEGVDGNFRGRTMGGALILHDVRGEAELKTMGGNIELTDSELDGSLKTMGGPVLFENVVGDVTGSSMGGNVRFKNVVRRGGGIATPPRLDDVEGTTDTVQISTMGGSIEVDDAPEGANLHTMGGDIRVTDAVRFVSAKTMGGDVTIEAVDGWVKATTMGGDVDVKVTGSGGDIELTSMSGDITLVLPPGFSMEFDLEIAYTRGSNQDYKIITGHDVKQLATQDWDHDHGSPRKYIRGSGSVGGGQNRIKIRTVNGNIRIE